MKSIGLTVLTVATAVVLAIPAAASAQAPPPAEAPPPAQAPPPAAPPFTAGWQDGFFVQSSNGDYRLVLGVTAQVDGRFSLDDPLPITNTFTIRKMRPTLSGRVAKYFDFKVMPDFGNGTAVLLDAYFDIRFSPKFRVRTGKDKTPIGYELLQGDPYLLFPERSLASSLVPNRDVGIQVQGDLSPRLFYAAGIFNGVPDGVNSVTRPRHQQRKGSRRPRRLAAVPFDDNAGRRAERLRRAGRRLDGTARPARSCPRSGHPSARSYFAYAADGQRERRPAARLARGLLLLQVVRRVRRVHALDSGDVADRGRGGRDQSGLGRHRFACPHRRAGVGPRRAAEERLRPGERPLGRAAVRHALLDADRRSGHLRRWLRRRDRQSAKRSRSPSASTGIPSPSSSTT